ncbi:hypothetical protein AN643_00585 [Candidatus Epulonipiscioides saccharophilum]|nr:hypothetical protein AN643_00585 [Epulopiscium sp. SCG-B10WGA-EpuloB]
MCAIGKSYAIIRFKQNKAEEISGVFSIDTIMLTSSNNIEGDKAIQSTFGSRSLGLEEAENSEMPYVDFEEEYFEEEYFEEEWDCQNDPGIDEVEFVYETEFDFVAEELGGDEIIGEEIFLEEFGAENDYFEEEEIAEFEIFDELLGEEEAFLF